MVAGFTCESYWCRVASCLCLTTMFLLSYLSVCLSSFPETQTGVSHRGKPCEGVMKEAPLKPSLLALFVC